MSALLSYMTEKGRLLAESYQANCLAIAHDIAALLLDSGSQPFIVCLYKVEDRGGNRFHYPLIPKQYGGRITWTKHYVCCCGSVAYDPMLREPVPIEQYSRQAFGEDFPMARFVTEEAMRQYLGRC